MHSTQSKNKHKPNPKEFATTLEFEAIGSHWQIASRDLILQTKQKTILQEIAQLTEHFDRSYSRFRSDSLITTMAKNAGKYRLPPDAQPMLDLYKRLYKITNGAMTPLIGQVLEDAGYDASYSLQATQLHTPPRWEDILSYTFPYITLKQPALLDFGALGKGYLIDLISKLLQEAHIRNFCVEAGGDMYYQTTSDNPLRVGLEHPEDSSMVIGIAAIRNQSICASAGNRRKWGTYHHIINPHTLASPQEIKASWVIANTAIEADALATSLFFVRPDVLAIDYSFEWVIMHADSSLQYSANFPAEFFTTS